MEKFQLQGNNLKSEKGSITLFVLTTMLFLLGVLIISYMGIRGKVIEQEKQIKKIQEEYNTVDMDQQYYSTVENLDLDLQINLYEADTKERHSPDKWTNKNLIAKVIWPENAQDIYKSFYIGEESIELGEIESTSITEYKRVSASYKAKNKSVIAKIDKQNPAVKISSDKFVIITIEGVEATIEANITAKDTLSGIKEIKYIWSQNDEEPAEDEYQTIEIDSQTKQIEESISTEKPVGIYYLWVIATDNAGNETISTTEYIITERLAPTVTIKYSDSDGAEYTGEWTNQDIYTEITIDKSEGNVNKYEYSIDNATYEEISEEENGEIIFYEYEKNENTVTYKMQDEVDYSLYFRALYDDDSYSTATDDYTIRIDKTAPTASFNYEYVSQEQAKIVASDIVEKASGMKGYYISTEETEPTIESTWVETSGETINIENLSTNTNYYIWLIDNVGNISEKYSVEIPSPNYSVDDEIYVDTLEQAISSAQDGSEIKLLNDYEDTGVATIDKNINLDVQTYTLTRTQVITINSGKTVNITGSGVITSSTSNNTISNAGTLTVNMEGKIESSVASASYNTILNTGTLTIENGTISGYYKGIYNDSTSAVININQGTIESTYKNNNAYAIRNYRGTLNVNGGDINGYYGIFDDATSNKVNISAGSVNGTGTYGIRGAGTIVVNGGNIKGLTYGIYQYSGTLTVNEGTVEGDYGIYQNSNAIVKILGGKVQGYTYGVYGTATGKITIGDATLEVNKETPIVSGGLYGIYMKTNTHSYNFNNGIIIGDNTTPHTETVVPRDGYMVYTYYDYDSYRKYCSILDIAVDNITIEQNPTEWTNQDVEVQVKYPVVQGSTLQFSEDGENWKEVRNGYITKISENKTIYARMLDSDGIIIEKAEHEITNIDSINPTLSISPETTKYIIYDYETTTSVDISVTVTLADEGGSGLNTSKYGWSNSKEEEPTQWAEFSSGNTITKTECEVGIYYLWFDVSDVAGNTSDVNIIKYIVEFEEAVARVLVDGEYEYYSTIQDAIDSAGTTTSTVEIIKDTNEEAVVQEGQNIILDLQGCTIGSSSSEQAVITNNGTLQIIDSSENKTGTIENLVGTAITNNGTLTIGDKESSIEDDTPTISGNRIGIANNSTLNYYDGTIKGKISIQGDVQDTPENYGPVGVYENGKTIVNLRITSDYVARIEWFYYTTLQGAIDACEARENNTTQTTVVMLKDIVLNNSANVHYGQNVRLNLNGYTLTSSKGSVITNNGELEIVDLSEEQTGNIFSSVTGSSKSYYKLINNQGELIVTSGSITVENDYNYPIYNGDGNVEIKGVTVNINSGSQYSYGIYNASTGNINVTGGTVSININRTSYGYGIYNASTGNINVSDGIFNINHSGYISYGIYNSNIGEVNVTGGIVSASKTTSWGSAISGGIYNLGVANITGGTISASMNNTYYYSNSYGIYNLGIVNMTDGTVSSSNSSTTHHYSCGIYNGSTGMINIEGGTVSSDRTNVTYGYSTSSGIRNEGTGTINIKDAIISSSSSAGSSYGIYNGSTGTINVDESTINTSNSLSSGSAYGVYNVSTGTINIGTKGDGIVSGSELQIISERTGSSTSASIYGIYNRLGTVNFYDGIIKSSKYIANGGITEIEDNYMIKEEEIDGYNSIYLVPVDEENYVIENTKTGKQYTNVKDAINEVTEDAYELKILQDMALLTKINIPENTNVKIDLNGKSITNNCFRISNYGNLEITDSVQGGKFINYGPLICNLNKGTIQITEGEVTNTDSSSGYVIYNASTGTINVTGGEVSVIGSGASDVYAIYNASTGTINVIGGIVSTSGSGGSSDGYAIYNVSTGIINITGGEVSTNNVRSHGIHNASEGEVNITGGTINTTGTYNTRGIYNAGTGTINALGGTIMNNDTGLYPTFGIDNASTGTINVKDCFVSSTSARSTAYGIYNASTGEVNVAEGEVSSSSVVNSYGIYNTSTGVINLGTKGDGVVSDTTPHITSEYTGTSTDYNGYGIYNASGTFNFYDGIIEGTTRAIPEDHFITEIEDDTTTIYENEDTVLTLSTGVTNVAKIGDVEYDSLQNAIDSAGQDETTIELLRGIQYTNSDTPLTIAENQNITLDLKGYSIASAIEGAVITNNGKLKITDSTEEAKGKISSTYEMTIYNKEGATLELENGTITRNIAKNNVVYNDGTVNVTGGTISQPGNSGYSIYNAENSALNISSGAILGGAKGIYNVGNTNITDGTIENGITNEGVGVLKIEGGTITGEVTNNATIEMTGGSILVDYTESEKEKGDDTPKYGIYSSEGTVTIGTKDGEITETPVIEGVTSGIYSTSILNIYDGIIKGTTSAINGEITEIEENSGIIIGEEEEYETLSLIKIDAPLAQVDENEYYSLKEAIESISGEGTVTILREGTVAETITITEDQDITLNLNGNTLNMYTRIQNTGTLKITDTSTEKTGVLTSYKDSPIYNSGNLSLIEGTISGNSYGIYNKSNGTTNIEGGSLTQNTYGIYAVDGVVNVNAGAIFENTYGTFAYGKNAIVNITGGNINNNEYGVYNGIGTTDITGGTISQNANEIYNGGAGTINITSGSIITTNKTAIENASNGTIVIGTEDGNVTLDSPVIQAEEYGITNSGSGAIKFYDGTIKGRKGGLSGVYLYIESGYSVKTEYINEYYTDTLTPSGTVTTVAKIGSIEYTNLQSAINACTAEEVITITLVNSINTSEVFSIEEGQNVIIDLNGKVIASTTVENIIENAGNLTIIDSSAQTGKVTNSYDVAITNTGTLTLGQDDGTVSTTCPEISGTTYGIKNTGTFNFYDGIVKASVAIDGSITSRASGYVISKTTVDAIEQLVLSK